MTDLNAERKRRAGLADTGRCDECGRYRLFCRNGCLGDDGFDLIEQEERDARLVAAIERNASWTPRRKADEVPRPWFDPRAARTALEAAPDPPQAARSQPSRGPDDWWRRQYP